MLMRDGRRLSVLLIDCIEVVHAGIQYLADRKNTGHHHGNAGEARPLRDRVKQPINVGQCSHYVDISLTDSICPGLADYALPNGLDGLESANNGGYYNQISSASTNMATLGILQKTNEH